MEQVTDDAARLLEPSRNDLKLLARVHLAAWPAAAGALDSSDVVQKSLLKAVEHRAEFRARGHGELAAWLRAILTHRSSTPRGVSADGRIG